MIILKRKTMRNFRVIDWTLDLNFAANDHNDYSNNIYIGIHSTYTYITFNSVKYLYFSFGKIQSFLLYSHPPTKKENKLLLYFYLLRRLTRQFNSFYTTTTVHLTNQYITSTDIFIRI